MNTVDEILAFCKDEYTQRAHDEILLEAVRYIESHHDVEDIIDVLVKIYNSWLNVPADKINRIVQIVKIIRDSFIIINELDDESCMRNGRPTAHYMYGLASSMNAANYGYFLALQMAEQMDQSNALAVCNEALKQLHFAQNIELSWKTHPEESEYKQLIVQKNGSICQLIVDLMQTSDDFTRLNAMLAVFVQYNFDYLSALRKTISVNSNQYAGFGLIDAKFNSFDACDSSKAETLEETLRAGETTDQFVNRIKNLPRFKRMQKYLISLERSIREEAQKFGANDYLDEFLHSSLSDCGLPISETI